MSGSVDVRPYQAGDKQGVIELWREVFPDAPAHNDPALDIERKLAVQPELFFIAGDGEAVVGSAMAGFDGHRGWVYYVAVATRCRRTGVGRALMSAVERGLAEIGCGKLNLQIRAGNEEVRAFYQALGYETEERISMGKRLR